MPESVTISWDEWEAMQEREAEVGEIMRLASNWEITYTRVQSEDPSADESQHYLACEALAEAVDRTRAPGYRRRDRKVSGGPQQGQPL